MRLQFNRDGDFLTCHMFGRNRDIQADCVVRNELNGWRPLHDSDQVILAMNDDPYSKPPVMPRQMPVGVWNIGKPRPRTDPYKAPFYIPTDAEQLLEIWSLDYSDGYEKPTGRKVLDMFYGLHFSTSSTTVGCIRIAKESDVEWLVYQINGEFVREGSVLIEVTEG